MKKELDEKLVKAFPKLYADRYASMRITCMCWGFPGDGWFDLLWRLSEKLEKLIDEVPITCAHCSCAAHEGRICPGEFEGIACYCDKFEPYWPRASQVKEKFALLRFYMTHGTDEMYKAIRDAENESATICEFCGKPGELRSGGWLLTLCDICHVEREERKKEEWRVATERAEKALAEKSDK